MSTVNKVILIANLTRDPESRSMTSGDQVVTLSLATNETWKDKQTGERKSKPEYHKLVIFNPHLCKVASNYLKKGSKVYIEGALQTRKWTDQSGVEKYTTEIVMQKYGGELTMLDTRSESGGQSGGYDQSPIKQDAGGSSDFDDSEIPF